ncbi:MAG: hypothetical protein C7B47_01940 [Sulfobacillus thermosulfidooxidans]|uniref:Uncharacterized protein n=1 Tax=Sulfobacillus thermosulfidooxidans TaxID=28034 RepID=A0A2T2X4T7_SULTH|nr:MAG: hypothetical protein C7B47_01940 [Sulfobacillus thermosulfidooxidans]
MVPSAAEKRPSALGTSGSPGGLLDAGSEAEKCPLTGLEFLTKASISSQMSCEQDYCLEIGG